jgi:hypothetical protein
MPREPPRSPSPVYCDANGIPETPEARRRNARRVENYRREERIREQIRKIQKKEEKADRTRKIIKQWRTAKINILVLALEGIIGGSRGQRK